MGLDRFRHARRIDADAIGVYHNDLEQLLHLDKGTANRIILKGGKGVTGQQLFVYPNLIDTHPRIQMYGTGDFTIYTATTTGFKLANSDGDVVYLNYPSAVPTIQTDIANKDLQLKANGTGRIRFGTHTGTGDAVSNGSVEIRDEGGTVRKLMTKA